MDFKFTEEEEKFRKEVREFIQQELPPGWEGHGYLFDFPAQYWDLRQTIHRKLKTKGWGPGQNLNEIEKLIMTEEASYWGAPGFSLSNFGEILVSHFGTEEQKKRFLPLLTGHEVTFIGLGLSEPNAGSDLAALQTKAVKDGDSYIINGQKTWQTDAQHAEWTVLLVRTNPNVPKHRGLSTILVDMKTPGITIQLLRNCYKEDIFADVFYDNVRVPEINLVGGENKGWQVMPQLLVAERGGAERIGASKRMLDELVKYAKETRRNGKTLAENPLVRQKLAQLAIEIEAGRWFTYRIAWMQSKGLLPAIETSVAKLYGGELVQRVGRVGMEILGLHGQLTADSKWKALGGKVQYWSLHTLCRTLGGGSSEMQRDIIARSLGLPRQ